MPLSQHEPDEVRPTSARRPVVPHWYVATLMLITLAVTVPIVYAPQILAWTFDLRWQYTVRVKAKDKLLRFRRYCWPVVQTRWAQPRGETFDDCTAKDDRFVQGLEDWNNGQEELESILLVTEDVIRYGDADSMETFATGDPPPARASRPDPQTIMNEQYPSRLTGAAP